MRATSSNELTAESQELLVGQRNRHHPCTASEHSRQACPPPARVIPGVVLVPATLRCWPPERPKCRRDQFRRRWGPKLLEFQGVPWRQRECVSRSLAATPCQFQPAVFPHQSGL